MVVGSLILMGDIYCGEHRIRVCVSNRDDQVGLLCGGLFSEMEDNV